MNYQVTFLGHPMSQEWIDIHIWETFFTHYPIRSLIELGTGLGGLSVYFALQCRMRGAEFITYDHQNWTNFTDPVSQFLSMNMHFRPVDIFSEDGSNEVAAKIRELPKPLAIFFDNGNKPREWSTFAPLTSPGDFCIVHDWETEFFPEHIGGVKVERILTDLSDTRPRGWKSMWFQRLP